MGTASPTTNDNSYDSNHQYQEATGITPFSPFGVKSGTALPVELIYFQAKKEREHIQLHWQTGHEINNSHFDMEWSTDGNNFKEIGAVAGIGSTSIIQFYDFSHQNSSNGKNHYRLQWSNSKNKRDSIYCNY